LEKATEILVNARVAKGLTQSELAAMLNIGLRHKKAPVETGAVYQN